MQWNARSLCQFGAVAGWIAGNFWDGVCSLIVQPELKFSALCRLGISQSAVQCLWLFLTLLVDIIVPFTKRCSIHTCTKCQLSRIYLHTKLCVDSYWIYTRIYMYIYRIYFFFLHTHNSAGTLAVSSLEWEKSFTIYWFIYWNNLTDNLNISLKSQADLQQVAYVTTL